MKAYGKTITLSSESSPSFKQFLTELKGKKKILSLEDEQKLFAEYEKTKDKKIFNTIIESNILYCVTIANKYNYPGISQEDLVNQGILGLIIAFNSFDYKKGFKFISYAHSYIRREISNFGIQSSFIKLPLDIPRIMSNLSKINNNNISDDELIEKYNKEYNGNLTLEKYAKLKNIVSRKSKSLNLSDSADESEHAENDKLNGDISINYNADYDADYKLKNLEKRQAVINTLKTVLNNKEYNVICLSFGITENPEQPSEQLTINQIADRFECTREYINTIYNKSIKKLQVPEYSKLLKQIL